MQKRNPLGWTLAALGLLVSFVGVGATAQAQSSAPYDGNGEFATRVRNLKRPHLTVVISIDQFRADYIRRYADLFLPAKQSNGNVGGFRYLMTQGSYYIDARYGHAPTFTAPGHAVILTGGYPYKTGIVANDWWDKTNQASLYCVYDPRQKVVGAGTGSTAQPMGPLNLRSSTVGDELKLATADAAHIVTISLKDRAAILLGGHTQDVSVWYDDAGGRWISSTAFCKDGKLPAWVEAVNNQAIPDQTLGTTWNFSGTKEALARTIAPNLKPSDEPNKMGLSFPHTIGKDKVKTNYRAFTLTPAANAYVFSTAKQAVVAEKMGEQGDTPDLLAMVLATNDYVGHAFGPYSPEALDVTLNTDKQIADFLNFLNTTVPGGLKEVVFVITADHGVVPVPETLKERDITSDRIPDASINDAALKALNSAFGEANWLAHTKDGKVVGFIEPYLDLDEAAIAQALASGKATSRAQIEEVAARAVAKVPGIYECYTHSQIAEGRLPQNEITRRVVHGFYPSVSGDVFVISEALYFTGGGVTTHGTPYAYDTHVPILIAGPGIRAGVWTDPVSPADIAPTLCALLGIEFPSACDGHILPNVFK